MSTILVTGASGFVGSWFVPALLGAGHSVRALVRDDASGARVQKRVPELDRSRLQTVIGDVTKAESLAGAVRGADAVIHLVAIPRDWNGGKDLLRVNLGGTTNLLGAMENAGVRRLVHQGALGVAEDPALHYASSKAQAEDAVASSALDWTIVRPSLLFGARDGFFNTIAGLVRPPIPAVPIPAAQRSRFQPLWVGDLTRVVLDLIGRPDALGQRYEVGGPDRVTYREMVQEVIRALDKRRFIVPVPLPLIKLVARGSELAHLPFPVASDQLRQLSFDNVTAIDSVESQFGFTPRPLRGNLGYLGTSLARQEPASESPSAAG